MKKYAGWFCFVLLLGVVLGFTAGKWDVSAQTIDNQSTRWLAGTVSYGQWQDAFMLFDTQTNRLSVYSISGNKRLELLAVREISWDIKLIEFGKQNPTVKQIRESWEKERKAKDKEKGKK